jgi:hypothetical protein
LILLNCAALAACATQAPASSTGADLGHDTAAAAPRSAAMPPQAAVPLKREVLAPGYREVVVNGQLLYCRSDLASGSRAEKNVVCLTKAQLLAEQARAQQFIQDVQRSGAIVGGGMPGGMQGGMMSY